MGSDPNSNGYSNGNGNGIFNRYSVVLQILTVTGLAIGAFYAWVIAPLAHEIDHLKDANVTIREYDEFKKRIEEVAKGLQEEVVPRHENEASWRGLDGRLSTIEKDINGAMSRGEVTTKFEDYSQRITQIRTELTDLMKDLGKTYNVGDQVKNLQKQLDDLRQSIDTKEARFFPVSPAAK